MKKTKQKKNFYVYFRGKKFMTSFFEQNNLEKFFFVVFMMKNFTTDF